MNKNILTVLHCTWHVHEMYEFKSYMCNSTSSLFCGEGGFSSSIHARLTGSHSTLGMAIIPIPLSLITPHVSLTKKIRGDFQRIIIPMTGFSFKYTSDLETYQYGNQITLIQLSLICGTGCIFVQGSGKLAITIISWPGHAAAYFNDHVIACT